MIPAATRHTSGLGASKQVRRKPDELIAEAQAVLAKIKEPDYRDPAAGRRVAMRNHAADLYREACQATREVSPCVWAISLALRETAYEAEPQIIAATSVLAPQCVEKPTSDACRIFDDVRLTGWYRYSDAKTLCDRGLASACVAFGELHEEQSSEMYERACQLGYPAACVEAHSGRVSRGENGPQIDSLATRATELAEARCAHGYATSCDLIYDGGPRVQTAAIDGCARGYLDDCSISLRDFAVRDRQFERLCVLTGDQCGFIADDRRSPLGYTSHPLGVRDAFEHGCQFRDTLACSELIHDYRAKEYPEPVSGRADAIAQYLCTLTPDRVRARDQLGCNTTGNP